MKTTFRALGALVMAGAIAAQPSLAQIPFEGIKPTEKEAPTRQGTRGANFLQIGVGARAQGMSGAATSLIEGPDALFWNPAGAAASEQLTLTGSRQNLYADLDIAQQYAGLTLPAFGGVVGAHVLSLGSGEITRTTPANPNGGDPQFGQTFEWSSMSVGLSYARRLTDRLDVGATVKYVGEGITDARVSWGAVDVGTKFRTGLYGLTIGASVVNLGPSSEMRGSAITSNVDDPRVTQQRTQIQLATDELELPTLFRFSVGVDLLGGASSILGQRLGSRHVLNGEMAFNDAIDSDLQTAFGLEYGMANMLFLRAGKRFYNDDRQIGGAKGMYGLSGGFGLRVPAGQRGLRFDYAYTSLGDLNNVQVFSLEFGQ